MYFYILTSRYLASGCSLTELHYVYRIGISTLCEIVRNVCYNIWITLQEQCIPKPKESDWKLIADNFQRNANFPNCVGAVDGKHIRIIKPAHSGSMYYNYKNYFSIVLLAVADCNYQFVFVDIGSYGKDCDSNIFKSSSLWSSLHNESLKLPHPEPLPGYAIGVPYVFVADEAFPLHKHIMRPFGNNGLTYKKKIFNYRLSRARRYVECAFGILSNKWRIFHRPLNVTTDFAVLIIKACCVLHNFVRVRDGFHNEDITANNNFVECNDRYNVRGGQNANNIRNIYADYFVSESGSLSWQDSYI